MTQISADLRRFSLHRERLIRVIRRWPLASFFVLAFLYSWVCRVPAIFAPAWPGLISFLSLLGPAFAALTVWFISGERLQVEAMFRSLFRWRVHPGWYLAALFLSFVLFILAYAVNQAIWYSRSFVISEQPASTFWPGLFLFLANFLYLMLLVWGEEIGWRGYALPKLQARLHPLAASAILGALWGAWHLPNFWIAGSPQQMVPVWAYLLYIFGHTFLYSWIYNGTQGSLLLTCIHHAATNAFFASLAAFPVIRMVLAPPYAMLAVVAAAVMLVIILTRKTLLAKP